jgi:hypothetical protein
MKNTLDKVQHAADTRRTFSAVANRDLGDQNADMFALQLSSLGGSTSHSTVSVMLASDGYAFYAAQSGRELPGPVVQKLGENGYANLIHAASGLYKNKPSPSGMHAEMTIIRYLYDSGGLRWGKEADDAQAKQLRMVCIGKLVCADCSGWLRAHGIPHFKVDGDKATPQWVHPRTGAMYRGGFNVKVYMKQDQNTLIRGGAAPPSTAGFRKRLDLVKAQ